MLKNLKNKEFYFHNQFNLIIGANGSGKTALLEALNVAVSGLFSELKQHPSSNHIFSDKDTNSCEDQVSFQNLTQHSYKMSANASIYGCDIDWQTEFDGVSLKPEIQCELDLDLDELNEIINDEIDNLTLPIISYYSSERLWDSKKFNQINKCFSLLTKQQLQQIEKAIVSNIKDIKAVDYNNETDKFVVYINDEWKTLSQLNNGYKSILLIVIDIALKSIKSQSKESFLDLTEAQGIVFIDELEQCLHPKLQQEVVDNFRKTFPKIQFFATTHSPFLIQSLHSENELLSLDGGDFGSLANKSINHIAQEVQNVEVTSYSLKYKQAKDYAVCFLKKLKTDRHYMQDLANSDLSPFEKLEKFKQSLDLDLEKDFYSEWYSNNPSHQSFLDMQFFNELVHYEDKAKS